MRGGGAAGCEDELNATTVVGLNRNPTERIGGTVADSDRERARGARGRKCTRRRAEGESIFEYLLVRVFSGLKTMALSGLSADARTVVLLRVS
jgi:hypothetical protein